MDKNQIEYITSIQGDLLDNISWNVKLVARLQSAKILSGADISKLKAILDEKERIWELIELLKMRTEGYKELIDTLEAERQSGGANLLKNISKSSNEGNNQYKSSKSSDVEDKAKSNDKYQYQLDFNNLDVKTEVLPVVQADLIGKMGIEESNTKIILELASLNIFDRDAYSPILHSPPGISQQKRMTELFTLIGTSLDSTEILMCFERLCNLKDIPIAARRIRGVFDTHFPMSVKDSFSTSGS